VLCLARRSCLSYSSNVEFPRNLSPGGLDSALAREAADPASAHRQQACLEVPKEEVVSELRMSRKSVSQGSILMAAADILASEGWREGARDEEGNMSVQQ